MRHRLGPFFLFCSLFVQVLLSHAAATASGIPPLQARVNDTAGMISPQVAEKLEATLADFEKNESTQVVILTVPSLEGVSIEDFSISVVEAWKIGQKGYDNGVLLLVSRDDRKVRIEVGYGLEGRLTDLLAGRIVADEIAPEFREGRFDAGFERGVQSILLAVQGEYEAKRPPEETGGVPSVVLFLLVILLLYFIGQIPRDGGPFVYGGGGGFGGGGFSGGGGRFGGGGASGSW